MNSSFSDRFEQACQYKAKQLGIAQVTRYLISRSIKVSQAALSNFVTKGKKPSPHVLNSLCNYFGVNEEWLLTGIGEMERTNPYLDDQLKVGTIPKYLKVVPVVTLSNRSHFIGQLTAAKPKYDYRRMIVYQDGEYEGAYFAFEIEGDAMDDASRDAICGGDIVLIRKIAPEHWKKYTLTPRKSYVAVIKNEMICRQISLHQPAINRIVFQSRNLLYPTLEHTLDQVKAIFEVVRLVDRKL